MGHGDSAIYPGGAPDTGEQTHASSQPRVNNTITRCDIHHNTLGYSGTMGNGTRVVNNDFYDNGTAIATDSFYAGGHPGYPQDGADVREQPASTRTTSTATSPESDVEPKVPVPVGVGILIAGGNGNEIRGNRIWDNWRRGTMLINVPDSFSGELAASTRSSHRNRYHDNVMGIGAERHARCRTASTSGGTRRPRRRTTAGSTTARSPRTRRAPLMPSNCDNTSAGVTYTAQVQRRARLRARARSRAAAVRPEHLPVVPDAREAARRTASGGMGLPVRASGAPKVALLAGDCRLVGSTLSCNGLLDRP